jgi:hypothetical protein
MFSSSLLPITTKSFFAMGVYNLNLTERKLSRVSLKMRLHTLTVTWDHQGAQTGIMVRGKSILNFHPFRSMRVDLMPQSLLSPRDLFCALLGLACEYAGQRIGLRSSWDIVSCFEIQTLFSA